MGLKISFRTILVSPKDVDGVRWKVGQGDVVFRRDVILRRVRTSRSNFHQRCSRLTLDQSFSQLSILLEKWAIPGLFFFIIVNTIQLTVNA